MNENFQQNYAFSIVPDEEFTKNPPWFIPVDSWTPNDEDKIFRTVKGALILPVSKFYGVENPNLDTFVLSTKRCYNGTEMLDHLPLYMNYFIKFYDPDKELLMIMYHIKYMMDYYPSYTKDMFVNDLFRMIMSNSIMAKANVMNDQNYTLNLDKKNYRNDKNPSLQYRDRHAKILMLISLIMNMMIPLLTHFIYVNKLQNSNQFLLEIIDIILERMRMSTGVDMYNKLYETSISNVTRDTKDNSVLWEMQD